MLLLLRLRVLVQQGGRIEINSPSLRPGDTVDVSIETAMPAAGECSILDVLAKCPGGVLFKTADEVDTYMREERDSWG